MSKRSPISYDSLTLQTDDVTSGRTRYVTWTLTSGYGWFRGEGV